MNGYLLKRIKDIDIKTALELFMLLSLLVVWVVWPIRGTIAARNIALVTGAITAIVWLYIERPKFVVMDLLPIGSLLCVPAWLLGLYIFKPVVPNLQWDDLRGTWLRVIIAIIFSFGLGKLYLLRPRKRQFFFWLLFIWPVVILLLFIAQGVFTYSWFGEQIYILVFKSKVAGIYFLIWSLLLCFSMGHWYFSMKDHSILGALKTRSPVNISIIFLFLICIVDFFSLQSLNGFIAIFIFSIFAAYLAIKQLNNRLRGVQYLIRIGYIWVGICLLAMSIMAYDAKFLEGKLTNLGTDVHYIIYEDVGGAWKWNGPYKGVAPIVDDYYRGIYPPINIFSGKQVHGSTYERVTWAREGLRFFQSNLLGLGYTGQAFAYYMTQSYPGSLVTKTHSGWLDFALGAGLFGLMMVWAGMYLIFLRAKTNIKNSICSAQMSFYVCWCLVSLMLLWFIAEFSDREYIEHFFLMLTFFGIVVGVQKPCDFESTKVMKLPNLKSKSCSSLFVK